MHRPLKICATATFTLLAWTQAPTKLELKAMSPNASYMPVGLKLSEARPQGITQEPAYKGKPQYGTLRLGNGPHATYFVVLDRPAISPVLTTSNTLGLVIQASVYDDNQSVVAVGPSEEVFAGFVGELYQGQVKDVAVLVGEPVPLDLAGVGDDVGVDGLCCLEASGSLCLATGYPRLRDWRFAFSLVPILSP